MITDTKTIFEHWSSAELTAVVKNPEAVDPGMLDGVQRELERRAKEEAKAHAAREALQHAQEKIKVHERAEAARLQREQRRAQLFTPDELVPQTKTRLRSQLDAMARTFYTYGGHAEAFVMNALSMAINDGRVHEIVDALRGTDWPDRWSMRHKEDPDIVVYFGEVFPDQSKARKAS